MFKDSCYTPYQVDAQYNSINSRALDPCCAYSVISDICGVLSDGSAIRDLLEVSRSRVYSHLKKPSRTVPTRSVWRRHAQLTPRPCSHSSPFPRFLQFKVLKLLSPQGLFDIYKIPLYIPHVDTVLQLC